MSCLETVDVFLNWIKPRALVHFSLIAENPVVGAGPEARGFQFRRKYWCGPDRVVAARYSGSRMDMALQRLIDSIDYVRSRSVYA